MLRNKQKSLKSLKTKVLWRQNRIAEVLFKGQLKKIYGVQRITNYLLEESCIILAPKWQVIVVCVLGDLL